MPNGWFITANDIKHWTETNKRDAEGVLPLLVRKMIYASCKVKYLHMPSGDSIANSGWDGILEVEEGNEFIQAGKSVWEFGTDSNCEAKANGDYKKRTDNPGDINQSETVFVFVTSRVFQKKDSWSSSKNSEQKWKNVIALNADDLESWLHQCPGVHRWFANILGKRTDAVWDIEQAWNSWIHVTSIPLNSELVLNGRFKQLEKLITSLKLAQSSIIRVKADSEEEAYAFILASLNNDEELAPRILVVRDQSQWDILSDSQNTLILIPYGFVPSNVGYAKQKGHSVILPVGLGALKTASEEILLERMSRDDILKALQSLGLDERKSEEIYKNTRGYLGVIRRHKLLGLQESIIPTWVDQYDINILAAVLFASQWDYKKEKDKEVLSKLAGIPYNELEKKLFELVSQDEPPIRLVGNIWQVASKIDLWSQIAKRISRLDIERLEQIVFDVLGELDPSYELPPEERWMANVKGVTPEYSGSLKSGLADTLALLAAFGNSDCRNLGEMQISNCVNYWVKELLKKCDSTHGWYSLGISIIKIAEASPEKFLQALERSMNGDNPAIKGLFINEGDCGGFSHAPILWALESISWNLDFLPLVTNSLAKLIEINPGLSCGNHPFGSLTEIYCGWINNTMATHKERLEIIDSCLIKLHSDVAWRLLMSLLPEIGGTSTPIHKPYYRDWAEGIKITVDPAEYSEYIDEISSRLINLIDVEPNIRFSEMIENIIGLNEKYRHEFIQKLVNIDIEKIDNETRLIIAEKLREIISIHRKYKDARWALPDSEVNELEKAFHLISDKDPISKNQFLFNELFPKIIYPKDKILVDYREIERFIEKNRLDAVLEINDTKGLNGIKELIKSCEHPEFVSQAIAKSNLRENLENEILSWLDNEDEKLRRAASSFTAICAKLDNKWIKEIVEGSQDWSKEKLTCFLLHLPFTQNTFDFLEKMDQEISIAYWKKIQYFYFWDEKEFEKINWVIEKLLANGRPLAAIRAASQVLHGSYTSIPLNLNLLMDILKRIAFEPIDIDQIPLPEVKYDILKAIKYLQEQEQLSPDEIAQIEWLYIGLDSFYPKYLILETIKNPSFFAKLVSLCYKSEKDEENDEQIDDESVKLRAKNAYKLINMISRLPGLKEDGTIDAKELRQWVYEARKTLEFLGRRKIGDIHIGYMLSKSPKGYDGNWPHEVIRDMIEELQNHEIESALETGKFNLNGSTVRGPYDGGEQEKILAEGFKEDAKKIRMQWPRTAEILRRLARTYDFFGEKEDWEVDVMD